MVHLIQGLGFFLQIKIMAHIQMQLTLEKSIKSKILSVQPSSHFS